MKKIYIYLGILLSLSLTRFIPHPPNFTSLIALSFYVPAIFGLRYLPLVILSFILTDLVIGFHDAVFFTWGSVLLIGLVSKFMSQSIIHRILGGLTGALIFYIVTNFGVWTSGMYGYTLAGFIKCYVLAIPFFAYSLISTLIFSSIIEMFYRHKKLRLFLVALKNT